jgi:hypothetical protein
MNNTTAADSDSDGDDTPEIRFAKGMDVVQDSIDCKYALHSYDDDTNEPGTVALRPLPSLAVCRSSDSSAISLVVLFRLVGLASINAEVDELIAHNTGCTDDNIAQEVLQTIAEEELDDLIIRPNDHILLTGVTEVW